MPTTVKKISINPKFNDKISPKRSSIDGYSTNYSSYRPAHPEKQGIGQTILPAPLRHPKPCMDSLIGQSRQPTLSLVPSKHSLYGQPGTRTDAVDGVYVLRLLLHTVSGYVQFGILLYSFQLQNIKYAAKLMQQCRSIRL